MQSVLVCHTRSHLNDANATRLAMSLQKNTLCKVVGHQCGQDLIGMLASFPDPISWALQGLSVRHCVHHVCCKATQMQLTHKLLVVLPMKRELKENRVCSEERRSVFLSSGWIERERERERTQRGTQRAQFEGKWTKWNEFIGARGQWIWDQRCNKFSYHDIWLSVQVLFLLVVGTLESPSVSPPISSAFAPSPLFHVSGIRKARKFY